MSAKKEPIKIYEDPKASSTPERRSGEERLGREKEVQATVATREGGSQVEEADTAQVRVRDSLS